MNDSKFGLVVLNYLTYHDTLELAGDIVKNVAGLSTIYIVDNKSNFSELMSLRNSLSSFAKDIEIKFYPVQENIGFSRGMNIGIDAARADECNFVVCANSDIRIDRKLDLRAFSKEYENDPKIGLVGPAINDSMHIPQNPLYQRSPLGSSTRYPDL